MVKFFVIPSVSEGTFLPIRDFSLMSGITKYVCCLVV